MRETVAALVLTAALGAGGAAAAQPEPLHALRWEKRVLLVFAGGDAAAAARQRALLSGGGAAERDLVVIDVPESGPAAIPGGAAVDAAVLRRAFGVATDAPFTVLLVGKDGGVKQRAAAPIPAEALFATIDAMPMRRSEMETR